MELLKKVSWDANKYGKFSKLIQDYLNQKNETFSLYQRFPTEENLILQTKNKIQNFPYRETTYQALKNQLKSFDLYPKQIENLEKFKLSNSVTITTGHQLNLLTGPLYFFYKILQTLKTAEELSQKHPKFHFLPVFWMATEDHDFEEINHFYFRNNKFTWHKDAKGAVGRLDLNSIKEVFAEFFQFLPDSQSGNELRELIESTYLNSKTLTEASQKLVQKIFGEKGLLMIDGDDKELKKLMIPAFEEDLLENTAFKILSQTNDFLSQNQYSIQVNPREINLFYLGEGNIRERILEEDGIYKVLNTNYEFSREEIIEELHKNPDKFSPNVILRPLYQETILPNISYIGGSGEIAYWLQLKSFFDSQNQLFPILSVRNSLLLLTEKQHSKLIKLNISYEDLFLPLYELVNENIRKNTNSDVNFDAYASQLLKIFDELDTKATETDVSFSKMVKAQRAKQLKGFEKMKNRWSKAEKIKSSERVERIEILYSELFPNGNLQERITNFSEFQLGQGQDFIDEIYREIQPFEFRFTIKTLP